MTLKYPTTSETLLDKISAGDQIGWNEFFERYSPVIKAVAKYKGLSETECEDICQQVMLQFFQQSKTFHFDPDIARFRTYFGRIIKAKIADHFRKDHREENILDFNEMSVDGGYDSFFMGEWRQMILKEAEIELKKRVLPKTYQAYELYAVQNRPVEKVAEFLGCSVNQVYQAKKRCFAMLREIICKMNDSDPELQMELSHYDL